MLLTSLTLAFLSGSFYLERPHLTIAQGMVESGMNQYAVGKSGEKGAWQVLEKHWGKVPKKLHEQAKQSEKIINELLAESRNDLYTAIIKYNGSGNKAVRYAQIVRKRTFERILLKV